MDEIYQENQRLRLRIQELEERLRKYTNSGYTDVYLTFPMMFMVIDMFLFIVWPIKLSVAVGSLPYCL